jgi:hypothetical protein
MFPTPVLSNMFHKFRMMQRMGGTNSLVAVVAHVAAAVVVAAADSHYSDAVLQIVDDGCSDNGLRDHHDNLLGLADGLWVVDLVAVVALVADVGLTEQR